MDQPRAARPTLNFIDEYCADYRNLFSDVRSFEAFKHLHVGMISSTKRKTLPAIAELVGLANEQSLHHFLTQSPWSAQQLRNQRLSLTLQGLKGRKKFVIIDETGDKKKGRSRDYVSRQYLGKLGKIDNGIVAVTAWGLIDNITFPLMFGIYKPKQRLKADDVYHYEDIEKWWEIVSSAYLLVSLFAAPWRDSNKSQVDTQGEQVRNLLSQHPHWDSGKGWKNFLNNLRLISQPFICFNLIQRWLKVFPIPQLSLGFPRLISLMNFFPSPIEPTTSEAHYQFSSA